MSKASLSGFFSSLVLMVVLVTTSPILSVAQTSTENGTYSGASGDTVRVTLVSAIERALDISPEVRASVSKADYSAARLSFARSSRFLTEFTATSAHAFAPAIDNPNNTPIDRLYLDPDVRNDWEDLSAFNRVEFEALQPLWTWGQLGSSIKAAKAGVEVDEAGTRMTADDVAARTGELYYGLLLADALGRLTREAGDIVDQAKEEIDRLLEEGDPDVDYADLFQVQITEQEFLQRVIEVEESRKLARAGLSRQLFLPEGPSIDPNAVVLDPIELTLLSLESYQQMALQLRPELDQVSAGISARDALVDVARSDYYPKLFLGVNGKWSYADNRERQRNPYVSDPFLSRGIRAGLGMRINLNVAQTRAKVEQAEAQRSEVRFQGDALRQLVLFEVEEAYRKVLIAFAAVSSREEALLISKKWLRDEQINFDLDLGDTENLVKAVQGNLTLQAQREEAVHDYNVAVIRLLRQTGQLMSAIKDGTLLGL
ncbi:MAG: TolC family protein [Bacteroidetes bacterium]|nr:TolC family protein [Bacteroidota bacterium]